MFYSALSLIFPIMTHRNSIFVFLARSAHQGWNSSVSRTIIGQSDCVSSAQKGHHPHPPKLSEMHRPTWSYFSSFPWSSFESDLTRHLLSCRTRWWTTASSWDLGRVGGVTGAKGCISTFRSLCGPSTYQWAFFAPGLWFGGCSAAAAGPRWRRTGRGSTRLGLRSFVDSAERYY